MTSMALSSSGAGMHVYMLKIKGRKSSFSFGYFRSQLCRFCYKQFRDTTRFHSSPLKIKVPFFLIFGFNRENPRNKKGKRALLANLDYEHQLCFGPSSSEPFDPKP